MAKTYWMRFGSGDSRTYTGLSPTMLVFVKEDGTNVTPPAISEVGSGTGLYKFTFGTTQPIGFLADAATTSPGSTGRYVSGAIDPADRTDEYGATLVAIGTTNVALSTIAVESGTTNIAIGTTLTAIGNTLLALGFSSVLSPFVGSTASSFGSTTADPVDLFGYLKRILEHHEGNQTFIKTSGVLSLYTRGSSTLLRVKTLANSISMVTKT